MSNYEVVSDADRLRDAAEALHPDVRTYASVSLGEHRRAMESFVLADAVPLDIRVHFETAKNLYLYAWFVYRFYSVAEKHALATLEFALRERLKSWLREKYGPAQKVPHGLRNLFARAVSERLITNSGFKQYEPFAKRNARNRAGFEAIERMAAQGLTSYEFDESAVETIPEDYSHDFLGAFEQFLPLIRNEYAHGSSMLHSTVLSTFDIVQDAVNQLYSSNVRNRNAPYPKA